MNSFANRTALITGAGSGIGRQLARLLAAEGARVAALDTRADALADLAAELPPGTVAGETADVTDLAATRAAVRRLEDRLGAIDLLIACAGIGHATPADPFRAEDVNAILRVNLLGVVNSIDAVLPGMRQRGSGHLVALSSLASYRGLPLLAGYSASKAGLNALLDSLRVELKPHGITVTTLCPGWVHTPMTQPLKLRPKDVLPVDRACAVMLDAIRRRRPFVAFPQRMAWQVRLLRYLPQSVSDWLTGRQLKRARRMARGPDAAEGR
ncbi:MAG: SDR family NAD(P)-dependent oxidoreductase [Gemmataceae bacterium]